MKKILVLCTFLTFVLFNCTTDEVKPILKTKGGGTEGTVQGFDEPGPPANPDLPKP